MKSCKVCKSKFEPRSPMQVVCGWSCAAAWTKAQTEKKQAQQKKEERKADRAKRESLKTRSDWIKEAQHAVNLYVRLRDEGRGCISCGKILRRDGTGGGFDAGHWRSRGSAPHLRFEEDNIHGQCKQCNRHGSGMAIEYRAGLIRRIGPERVAALEADQTPRKWTADDLKAIRDKYRQKAKELLKQRD